LNKRLQLSKMSDSESDHGSYVKIEKSDSEYHPSDDESNVTVQEKTLDEELMTSQESTLDEGNVISQENTLNEEANLTAKEKTLDEEDNLTAQEKTLNDEDLMTAKDHTPDTSLNALPQKEPSSCPFARMLSGSSAQDNSNSEELPPREEDQPNGPMTRGWQWLHNLANVFKENRRGLIVSLLVIALGILIVLGLSFYMLAKEYQECKLEHDSLVRMFDSFTSGGNLNFGDIPRTDQGKSILSMEDLYVGKCKKLKFRTLEQLFGLKPGNLVICI